MTPTNETSMAWISPQRLVGRWQPEMFRTEYLELDRILDDRETYVRLGDLVDVVTQSSGHTAPKWYIDRSGIRRGIEVDTSPSLIPVPSEAILISKNWSNYPDIRYWNSHVFHGDAGAHWNYWVLKSRTGGSCGWVYRELQSKYSRLQLQRSSLGGLTAQISIADLLDLRVRRIEESIRHEVNEAVARQSKSEATSLLSQRLSRPFFLTGRTFEERMRQFEQFIEKEAWFSAQDAYFVEPATKNPNSDYFRVRSIGSRNARHAQFVPQEIPTASEAWRDWFWDQAPSSRHKVFNSMLTTDELPTDILACIVRFPDEIAAPDSSLLLPAFSTFREAIAPALETDAGLEDQIWLELWSELQAVLPNLRELASATTSTGGTIELSERLFRWSREAYRPALALKVTRADAIVGAYLLVGKDQIIEQLATYAELDDLGIVLSEVLYPPSDVVNEAASRESLRRLSNVMHQIKGPVGRVNNALTDVMEYLDSNPNVAQELVPTAPKARRRSSMPGGLGLDRQTMRARIEDAQKAVNDVKKVAYQLIQLRRVQARSNEDRKETFTILGLIHSCVERCCENRPEIKVSLPLNSSISVWADREQLRYAIEEVLINSSRELTYRKVDDPHIEIAFGMDGDDLWLRIADNGLPTDATLIADPFEECASTYERIGLGTGLGLTIVRETFLAHGGDCALEPNFGADDERVPGTTFHAHLKLRNQCGSGSE